MYTRVAGATTQLSLRGRRQIAPAYLSNNSALLAQVHLDQKAIETCHFPNTEFAVTRP